MSESMMRAKMEADIAKLEANLSSARLTAENSRNVQEDLFTRHAILLQGLREYDNGPQTAREASNVRTEVPLILLLIDANTCRFHDDLLKRRHKGGCEAAEALYRQALSVARKIKLPTSTCRIKIKCYGNMHVLSRDASRRGLVGAEGRSLSAFIFGFNSAFTGSEFVDVGEDSHERVAENASLYRSLPSCKHVIIAARPSDDVGWDRIAPRSPELARHTTIITRREGSAVPSRRGFAVAEFEDVFDWSELRPGRRSADYTARHSGIGAGAGLRASRYASPPPEVTSRIYANDASSSAATGRRGSIPVNKDDQRVDPPIPKLSGVTIQRYNDINPRPCNNTHLFGGCRDPGACYYDHRHLGEDPMNVLRVQMRLYPCKRRTACRDFGCLNSHMCRRCPGGIKEKACKLAHSMHGVNPTIAGMVPASDHDTGRANIPPPMPPSFTEPRDNDENAVPRETQGGSRHDAAEPFEEAADEGNVSDQMLLLEFSDDE